MAPSPNCTTCNKPPRRQDLQHKKCGGCNAAIYCSQPCQKSDWPIHKHVCEQFKSFATSTPRPSPSHKLAILLPVDQEKLVLVWVHCPKRTSYERAVCDELLGGKDMRPREVYVSRQLAAANGGLQRVTLDHTVTLVVDDDAEKNGSGINQCVNFIMKGKQGRDWHGPLLIFSQPGISIDPLVHQDVVPADLRIVADYFLSYGGPEAVKKWAQDLVTGVCIPSLRIIKIGQPNFVKIKISPKIFEHLKPTSISKYMGLPILVFKANDIDTRYVNFGFNPNENRFVVFLNLIVDAEDENWGITDLLEWDTLVGSVIVLRKDKKAMSVQQVEALAHFCRYVVAPGMGVDALEAYFQGCEDCTNEELVEAKRDIVKKLLSHENFNKFFEKFRDEKLAAGDRDWEHADSPFKT